jgi:Tol biopolymer transport system component
MCTRLVVDPCSTFSLLRALPAKRVTRNVTLISLAVALSGCMDSSPTEPRSRTLPGAIVFGAFPGDNGKIVFTSTRNGPLGIFTMDSDGANVQSIAAGNEPAWSPDGKRIAFSSVLANSEIFVMNADGSGIQQLTIFPDDEFQPSWSPDGKKIVFTRFVGGVSSQIFTMDVIPGIVPTQLTSVGNNHSPEWSPDGTSIVFLTDRDGMTEVYTMNPDGSAPTRLTTNGDDEYQPSWSPDGSQIAFARNARDIVVMSADGTNPVALIAGSSDENLLPKWSPDGSRLAFVSNRDGNYEIYVMNADGSNQTNISNNTASDHFPYWQPLPNAPTASEQIEALIDDVSQMAAPKGIKSSLTASLNDALAALGASDTAGACAALTEFRSKVNAQTGKKISTSDGAFLIGQASAIEEELDCAG